MQFRPAVKTQAASGFTLVELSIVLVIVGLIIGGVLVGRDLIRAAELKKFYSEREKIVLAVNTFRVKYNCLPGDCPTATDFFGTDPEGCPGPPGKTPKIQTCNGNGDQKISGYENESLTFWQQLSGANFWPGLFRGDTVVGVSDETINPAVSINRSFLWFVGDADDYSDMNLNVPYSSNFLGTFSFVGDPSGILIPAEAFSLDAKYDDGKPASGQIQAMNDAYLINCTTPSTYPAPNAIYDLTQTGKNCNLVFVNQGF